MNIVFFGMSGSGKTLASEYVAKRYGFISIHPIGDLKLCLQNYFDCASLDTEEGKSFVIPSEEKEEFSYMFYQWVAYKWGNVKYANILDHEFDYLAQSTLGQFMVNLYHVVKKNDIKFSEPYLKSLDYNNDYVFNAVRNIHEAKILKNYPVQTIWITRDNTSGLDTDLEQERIYNYLSDYNTLPELIRLENNTTIDNFKLDIDSVINELVVQDAWEESLKI